MRLAYDQKLAENVARNMGIFLAQCDYEQVKEAGLRQGISNLAARTPSVVSSAVGKVKSLAQKLPSIVKAPTSGVASKPSYTTGAVTRDIMAPHMAPAAKLPTPIPATPASGVRSSVPSTEVMSSRELDLIGRDRAAKVRANAVMKDMKQDLLPAPEPAAPSKRAPTGWMPKPGDNFNIHTGEALHANAYGDALTARRLGKLRAEMQSTPSSRNVVSTGGATSPGIRRASAPLEAPSSARTGAFSPQAKQHAASPTAARSSAQPSAAVSSVSTETLNRGTPFAARPPTEAGWTGAQPVVSTIPPSVSPTSAQAAPSARTSLPSVQAAAPAENTPSAVIPAPVTDKTPTGQLPSVRPPTGPASIAFAPTSQLPVTVDSPVAPPSRIPATVNEPVPPTVNEPSPPAPASARPAVAPATSLPATVNQPTLSPGVQPPQATKPTVAPPSRIPETVGEATPQAAIAPTAASQSAGRPAVAQSVGPVVSPANRMLPAPSVEPPQASPLRGAQSSRVTPPPSSYNPPSVIDTDGVELPPSSRSVASVQRVQATPEVVAATPPSVAPKQLAAPSQQPEKPSVEPAAGAAKAEVAKGGEPPAGGDATIANQVGDEVAPKKPSKFLRNMGIGGALATGAGLYGLKQLTDTAQSGFNAAGRVLGAEGREGEIYGSPLGRAPMAVNQYGFPAY